MKVTYYGTSAGGGIPEIFCSCPLCEYARSHRGRDIRTRSQAVIDGVLSLDYPVDILMHTIHGGLDMRKINHVLITHSHHDHFLPDDVLSRHQGMTAPVNFYAGKRSGARLAANVAAQEAAFASGKRIRTSDFTVRVHELTDYTPISILDYEVIPLPANHARELDAMIYLIRRGGKAMLWAHDTGPLFPEVADYIKHSGTVFDFVSLDCTLGRGKRITGAHMDIDQCAQTMALLRENGNADERTVAVISHMGHLVELTHEELSAQAAELGLQVAYDGMTVTF